MCALRGLALFICCGAASSVASWWRVTVTSAGAPGSSHRLAEYSDIEVAPVTVWMGPCCQVVFSSVFKDLLDEFAGFQKTLNNTDSTDF